VTKRGSIMDSPSFWEPRSWRACLLIFVGPWSSLGIHVDLAPSVHVHVGWLVLSFGKLRDSDREGYQFPPRSSA